MSDDTAAEALASAMNATLEPRYEGFALTVGNTSIILAALTAAGWALVPVAPTEAEIDAGLKVLNESGILDNITPSNALIVREMRRAMLAAASGAKPLP